MSIIIYLLKGICLTCSCLCCLYIKNMSGKPKKKDFSSLNELNIKNLIYSYN